MTDMYGHERHVDMALGYGSYAWGQWTITI